MGCDIHLFAEKKIEGKWVSIDKYTKNPDFGKWKGERRMHIDRDDRFYTGGRNYNLFCALCGVRSYHFENSPKVISLPKGKAKDCSQEIKSEIRRYGSDGHSHSWLTLGELKKFDWSDYGDTVDCFKKEVLPKMEAQGVSDDDVRIVFFFDN